MTYPLVDGKPVFDFDPNDCCFDLDCGLCGGRVWIGASESEVGEEAGICWYVPGREDPDPEKITWGMIVRKDERNGGFYVEPEGGW